ERPGNLAGELGFDREEVVAAAADDAQALLVHDPDMLRHDVDQGDVVTRLRGVGADGAADGTRAEDRYLHCCRSLLSRRPAGRALDSLFDRRINCLAISVVEFWSHGKTGRGHRLARTLV